MSERRPGLSRRTTLAALGAGLTAAASGSASAQQRPFSRIAFGSCAHQDFPQPIWEAVLHYRPDLYIFAGDNVYGDSRDAELAPLKAAYEKAATIEPFMRLRRAARHMAIWDDHDMGLNDGGVETPFKAEAKAEFLKFWNVPPNDPRQGREGLYHSETFGPEGQRVQVILLDTRWFRSALKATDKRNAPSKERYVADEDPAKTVLGEAQWAWLAERLREPADLRLVVSSIQLVVDGHGWERWGNFPRERQRFHDLVRDTGARGVVILSGDRHIGAIYRQVDGVAYPLVEMTSSGINRFWPSAKEAGPNRLGALYGLPNFGTIDIDWWKGEVFLALRDEAGQMVRQHTMSFDELGKK